MPFLILAVGALLRFVWGGEIEFKADEAYSYTHALRIANGENWSWVGMNSSAGVPNPGWSLWIFALMAKIFHIQSPVALARCVQALNVCALALGLKMSCDRPTREERSIWLWGMALAAVNPLGVVLQRKIWPQSVFPLFVMLAIFFWFKREKKISAFLWGFFGALLGQFHMAGFFMGAALVGWTWFFESSLPSSKITRWKSWWVGSILGAMFLIPWMIQLLDRAGGGSSYFKWIRLLMFKFWNCWIVTAIGTNLNYSLGKGIFDLFKYPVLWGKSTYLMGFAHVFLWFALGWLARQLFFYWKGHPTRKKEALIGSSSETAFLISAGFWGAGLLFTVGAIAYQTHYVLALFPLPYLWLSQGFLRFGNLGRRYLLWVCIAQLALTLSFLFYIHLNEGAPYGDYGRAYSSQVRADGVK